MPLLIDQFGFFAALFALLSFVHLCWPAAVKNVVDRVAEQIGGGMFESEYDEQYYSTIGGLYAFGALVMSLAALSAHLFG